MNVRSFIAGACIGAGVMYLADPKMGKRRLSQIRDQFVKGGKKTGRFFAGRAEDIKNGAQSLLCATQSLFGMRREREGIGKEARISSLG